MQQPQRWSSPTDRWSESHSTVLRQALDVSPVPQCIVDPGDAVVSASHAWFAFFGLSPEQALGNALFQLLPQSETALSPICAEVRRTHQTHCCQLPSESLPWMANASVRTLDLVVAPVDFPEGVGLLITAWQPRPPSGLDQTGRTARQDTPSRLSGLRFEECRGLGGHRPTEPFAEACGGLLRRVVENVIDDRDIWLTVLDRQGNVILWNRAAGTITGYSSQEVVGSADIWQQMLSNEERRREVLARIESVARGDRVPEGFETEIRCKDGQKKIIAWSCRALTNSDGLPMGCLGLGQDITERKRAEEALQRAHEELESRIAQRTAELALANQQLEQEVADRRRTEEALRASEEKFHHFVEHSDNGIVISDADSLIVDWNRAMEEITGLSRADVLGRPLWDVVFQLATPEQRSSVTSDRFRQVTFDAVQKGHTRYGMGSHEHTIVRPDGTRRILQITGFLIQTHSGGLLGGICHDVTERKQADQDRERLLDEIQRQVAELEAVFGSIADGVIACNPSGDIVRMNDAAQKILGYTPTEASQPLLDRLEVLQIEGPDGERVPVEEAPLLRALRGETVADVVQILHWPPGKTTCVSVAAAPIRSAGGQTFGAVMSLTDVTRLHELQLQRQQFMHTISHDLRGPLTIIIGHAQFIERQHQHTEMTAVERHSLTEIVGAARRLNVMIEDLVDSARLEGGRLEMRRLPVDLARFLPQLLQSESVAIDTTRVRLRLPADLPPVSVDPDRLHRILVNLLSNALKYSASGTEVSLSVEQQESHILFSVSDKGPGIHPEDLPRLFERFHRGRGPRTEASVGLGLYITKMLVEAHDGQIWVDSQPGQGSTFYFTLPLAN